MGQPDSELRPPPPAGATPAPPERTAALTVHGVVKSFGAAVAVDGVALTVPEGEFITLLGPSGSGKTTLLRLVAGFYIPDTGKIEIAGRDVTELPPNRRDVGFVFQNYALFPHLTVRGNLEYGLRRRRWGRAEIATRVDEVLAMMRLEQLAARRPHELSGGQQQRVAVGRALASRPALMLMDEPLAALDRALRLELQQELRRIHREDGTTVVYVTHDQEEALAMSDRIAVMRAGRVVELGPPRVLYSRPSDDFAATFLGDCNLFNPDRAELRGERVAVRWLGREFERAAPAAPPAADRYLVALRPGRLCLANGEEDVAVAGVVRDLAFLGESDRLTVMVEGLGAAVALLPAGSAAGIAVGDRVHCGFSLEDVFCVATRGPVRSKETA